MKRILGIDPGLGCTGWGVIEAEGSRLRYVACGSFMSNSKEPLAIRLQSLHEGLNTVIASYQPQQAAIEETFLNTNALSSLKLGHARGVLMLAVSLAGIPLAEYAARLVKKSVTGVGKAEKDQVAMMVKRLLPNAIIETPDAADALAVAICHSSHATLAKWESAYE